MAVNIDDRGIYETITRSNLGDPSPIVVNDLVAGNVDLFGNTVTGGRPGGGSGGGLPARVAGPTAAARPATISGAAPAGAVTSGAAAAANAGTLVRGATTAAGIVSAITGTAVGLRPPTTSVPFASVPLSTAGPASLSTWVLAGGALLVLIAATQKRHA